MSLEILRNRKYNFKTFQEENLNVNIPRSFVISKLGAVVTGEVVVAPLVALLAVDESAETVVALELSSLILTFRLINFSILMLRDIRGESDT